MELRITTFNVENLFNRYAFLDTPWNKKKYENFVQVIDVATIVNRQGELLAYTTTEQQRKNTALAIEEANPDVLAVQEVENLYTLRIFNNVFLKNRFDRMVCIDGNDPRGIDVGLLIKKGCKAEVSAVRTHVDEPLKGKSITRQSRVNFGYVVSNAVFSRDCLEVDLKVGKAVVTLLVNHLKAQDSNTTKSMARRKLQADRVNEIAQDVVKSGKFPIVMGDLNVDTRKKKKDNSLDLLLGNSDLKDPFPKNTWTHYYESDNSVSRLDYILPHKDLQVTDHQIVRKGLTKACKQYTGDRFSSVEGEHTEASDHCPTTVVIQV